MMLWVMHSVFYSGVGVISQSAHQGQAAAAADTWAGSQPAASG